jgi:hypothetical protein
VVHSTFHFLSLSLVTLLSTGCGGPAKHAELAPPQKQSDSSEDNEATKLEIIAVVSDSQRAGFEKYDIEAYLAPWSDDAKLISGRAQAPGPHDLVLSRSQIEATKRLRFTGKAPNIPFNPINPIVTLDGDTAQLHWTMNSGTAEFVESVDELYKLRRTEDGWQVYENRFWSVLAGPRAAPTKHDAAYYAQHDDALEKARTVGNQEAEMIALQAGARLNEAYLLATKIAASESTAEHWAQVAWLALVVGEVEVAKQAVCSAKAIDSKMELQQWAAAVTCSP